MLIIFSILDKINLSLEKKISIGIRVTPSVVFYSIVEETEKEYITHVIDKVNVPSALLKPEQLKFIRNTFLDIIEEFNISLACVRITESSAQVTNVTRIGIEAVIQELFASSSITLYYAGQISSITTKLGIQRDEFKPLADGSKVYKKFDNWKQLSNESRESILSAFSALNLN